jgi:glycerophosphoryl diester phosphodiesterase
MTTLSPRGVERIGHRGAPGDRVENTIPSFERAIELGADAVELDVHVSNDGVAVVHHDPTLGRRVHPIAMRGRPLRDATAAELASVDLGGGASLPTLERVLATIGTRARVYVEIKSGSEAPVVAVIRQSAAVCAVHSFDHDAIGRLAAIAQEIPRGILVDRYPDDVAAMMRRVAARDVWPAHRLIDAPLVDAIHDAGGRVLAWTVNGRRAARRLVALGVDGLCTNDLGMLGTLDD